MSRRGRRTYRRRSTAPGRWRARRRRGRRSCRSQRATGTPPRTRTATRKACRPERDVLGSASADEDPLDRLVERIETAGTPGLIVGGGVDQAHAWDEVAELAERLSGPVWTAPQAPRLGFAEDHPLYQGHLAPGRAIVAAQARGGPGDRAGRAGVRVPAVRTLDAQPGRAGAVSRSSTSSMTPASCARPGLSGGRGGLGGPRPLQAVAAALPAPRCGIAAGACAGGRSRRRSDPAGVPDGGARASAARGERGARGGVAVQPQ